MSPSLAAMVINNSAFLFVLSPFCFCLFRDFKICHQQTRTFSNTTTRPIPVVSKVSYCGCLLASGILHIWLIFLKSVSLEQFLWEPKSHTTQSPLQGETVAQLQDRRSIDSLQLQLLGDQSQMHRATSLGSHHSPSIPPSVAK